MSKRPNDSGLGNAARSDLAVQESISKLAHSTWLQTPPPPFSLDLLKRVYQSELAQSGFSQRRAMSLEFARYLEAFLWPHFDSSLPDKCTREHIISIAIMVNEKCREKVPAWRAFTDAPQQFPAFFRRVMEIALEASSASSDLQIQEEIIVTIFLNHCFVSLAEEDIIREQLKRIISLGMWAHLLADRREAELEANDKYRRLYRAMVKRDTKAPDAAETAKERAFLPQLLDKFLDRLDMIGSEKDDPLPDSMLIHYLERVLLFLIDLESMLLTRRYFNTVLDDRHIVVRCKMSQLALRPIGRLFTQLVEMLDFYVNFEIEDASGEALTPTAVDRRHCERVLDLQRSLFTKDPEKMRNICVANVGTVEKADRLTKELSALDMADLRYLAASLYLVPKDNSSFSRELIINILVNRFSKKPSQLTYINSLPLYPTEQVIWDENRVPVQHYSGGECLALPKLSLQFLTLHDYLLRNFNLFHLESTYQIRQDIEAAVSRLKPCRAENGDIVFAGWSRMAAPLSNFAIIEVGKPHLGSTHPSRVRADITVTLSTREDIKREWEGLRKHDPCFLITVQPKVPFGYKYNHKEAFVPQTGLVYVRGCEVEGLLDPQGKVIPEEERHAALQDLQKTDVRSWRVRLDPCQYQRDMEMVNADDDSTNKKGPNEDVYDTFNILLRRRPKENNFKAVLETIRDLMNTQCVVPDWLHDLLLGYEDPRSAHYSRMPLVYQPYQDWRDTFLDGQHLTDSLPQYSIKFVDKRRLHEKEKSKHLTDSSLPPPYRLKFPAPSDDSTFKNTSDSTTPPEIIAESYSLPFRPPQLLTALGEEVRRNGVRFTSTQTEAIRAGMQPGLTLVVGPPGTGKTDVAVQIISNIYHNYPNQRTLIVTHSNQALNQLFEKIMALDVNERHLLRLGHGEEALQTEKDFSRYGRVNYVLARRIHLLDRVGQLARSLGEGGMQQQDGDELATLQDYTCETAQHLFLQVVLRRWQEFLSKISAFRQDKQKAVQSYDGSILRDNFPFMDFFLGPNSTEKDRAAFLPGSDLEEDLAICQASFLHLEHIFGELDEFRAFELMRTGTERSNFLLVQEAKIIAMTCTHAALRRKDLVELGFTYDNILMEEAAQILEIETFIPLLLQNPDLSGLNRLKRWVMIGDHHQLPPVVKNMAFQNLCNMGQSLFTRLVKLGVPAVQLDAQGRARPSLARLYAWRYTKLVDLPHVVARTEFNLANPGFAFDYQFIDVADFEGVGESEPSPYFYQNLGEAEFVVAVYMYMRLLGYPSEKISILTTYNGQKHLLKDVVKQRCADNPLIGLPSKITTVDKYQGQQNDYILLSLVRSRTVGHLRDVRRLIVAMSRARLGLYVFGRVNLFSACHELRPALTLLTERPTQLHLTPWEEWFPNGSPNQSRRSANQHPNRPPKIVSDMVEMANFVFSFYNHRLGLLMTEQRRLQEWQHGSQRPPSTLPRPPQGSASSQDKSGISGDKSDNETKTQQCDIDIQTEPVTKKQKVV